MVKKAKSTVVSVRMSEATLLKMQGIQDLLQEKTNTDTTHGMLFANMINHYHKYLNVLDAEEHNSFIQSQLMKALSEESNEADTTT